MRSEANGRGGQALRHTSKKARQDGDRKFSADRRRRRGLGCTHVVDVVDGDAVGCSAKYTEELLRHTPENEDVCYTDTHTRARF
jgi:hypothetical protein